MRIRRVRLEDVRGVESCEVVFSEDGVTVVEAPNEAGKTTLLDAVDVLFGYKDSSNAQVVRDLAPVGRDVGSLVEVELTCGEVHLTCRKRFNRERETVLELHTPTREQLTGTDAHDRLRTILEADVDLALYGALRLQQGRDLDAIALGGSDALAARLDAAAGGSGATEGDALLERAGEAYEEHFTATGRPRKELTDLDEAVAELEEREVELAERQRGLEEDADELARIERELPELERQRTEEVEPALEEQRARLERLGAVRQLVDTRTAERDRAAGLLEAARRERQARTELAARLAELQTGVARSEEELGPIRDRLAATEDQLAERERELVAALEDARGARQARDRAEEVVALVTASEDRDRLRRGHDRVEAVTADAAAATEALARIVLDDDLLAEIRAASQDARIARSALEAGAPVVRLRARRSLEVDVDGDPATLDDGQELERTVGGRLEVVVPDVLDLQVRSGASTAELQRAVAEAEARLADACGRARVADLAEAEELDEQRRQHEDTLRRRDEALDRELDGDTPEGLAAALREAEQRVANHAARLPDDVEVPDLRAANDAAVRARAAADEADAHAEQVRAARDATVAAVQDQRAEVGRHEARHEQRQDELARLRTQLDRARAEAPDEELDHAVARAVEADEAAATSLQEVSEELAALDPEAVELAAEAARAAHDNATVRLRELGERRAALGARLEAVGAEGLGEALEEVRARLERAQADRRRRWARARAAEALYTALRDARDEAYRAYREPLRARIVAQARLLYGDDDVDVELDDELAVVARTLAGTTLRWEQLSAGAREQLAILTALAAAQLAGDDGVPFVLDDALGYTDPQRLERLGALLGRTVGAQVIVLTCMADRFRHVGGARTVRLLGATGGQDEG